MSYDYEAVDKELEKTALRTIEALDAAGVDYRIGEDGVICYPNEAEKAKGDAIMRRIEAEQMREIKFRGKRTDAGEWVYGYFVKNKYSGNCYIYTQTRTGGAHPWLVDPATVGQFTGLKDKNGVEICGKSRVRVNTLGINYAREYVDGIVEFIDGCFTVVFSHPVYDIHEKCNRNSLYVKCFVANDAIEVLEG